MMVKHDAGSWLEGPYLIFGAGVICFYGGVQIPYPTVAEE